MIFNQDVREKFETRSQVVQELRNFLRQQLDEGVERVSIPGVLSGKASLLMGQVVPFPSFRRAMEFVNQAAAVVERTDHYPDIIVSFRTVRMEMSTHDVGGLTERVMSKCG